MKSEERIRRVNGEEKDRIKNNNNNNNEEDEGEEDDDDGSVVLFR